MDTIIFMIALLFIQNSYKGHLDFFFCFTKWII